MVNDNKEGTGLEKLLREKEQIEKNISDRYREYVTIMFTDIAGYTRFVETHGDLAAKSLLQIHNDMIFPIINSHDGNVIKTIGDAIMASYAEPQNGVAAAVAIQSALKKYNETADKVKKINIRVGLHSGKAIRSDDGDYFGDAVNVAARIEPAGSAGQILISDVVYNALKECPEFYCAYFGEKKAKGKSKPLSLYRVFLNEAELKAERRKKETEEKSIEREASDERTGAPSGHAGEDTGAISVGSELTGKIPSVAAEKQMFDGHGMADAKDVTFDSAKSALRLDLLWKISIPVLLLLLVLFAYPGFLNRNGDSGSVFKRYVDGFTYLRQGDFEKARNTFVEIGMDDFRCQEGLAALAYKNASFEEADKLADRSINIEPEVLYPRVVKGNIHFDNARFDKAKEKYLEALELSSPLKWQKGEALYRLGRISSAENNPSEALQYYNQAFPLDEKNVDILTAKGAILERMGELTQALTAFDEARSLAPDDSYVKAFYRRAKQKLQMEQDKAHQERIESLVKDLVEILEKTGVDNGADAWSTRPSTLFFIRHGRTGSIPLREGEDDFFELELMENIRASNSVDMVERELLDKLLEELKLSSSDLADPGMALRLGRIVSANLIGNIRFIGLGTETKIYVKLIETETSAVRFSVSGMFGHNESPEAAAKKIATAIAGKITISSPVRGRIQTINENSVALNIGSLSGVKKEMMMRVFPNEESQDGEKPLTGVIKIISVGRKTSTGKIIKGAAAIGPDSRVEAVSS